MKSHRHPKKSELKIIRHKKLIKPVANNSYDGPEIPGHNNASGISI